MITMKDIADRVGVSRPTVSAVLNRKSTAIRIAESTRRQILAVADELGYLPNENARATRSGHTRMIGVIGRYRGGYAAEVFRGVALGVNNSGYSMKLVIPNDDEDFSGAVQKCIEQRVCGLIFFASNRGTTQDVLDKAAKYRIPVVMLDSNEDRTGCWRVASDDESGAYLATQYLLTHGHRTILFPYREQFQDYLYIRHRENGYRRALAEAKIAFDADWIVPLPNADGANEFQPERLLTRIRETGATALFCPNDYIAAVAIRHLTQSGLRVPEDLSVIGFGDMEFAPLLTPTLTTVAQPFTEMGQEAVNLLLQQLRTPTPPRHIDLATTLIVRNSVCCR